MFDAVLFDLDGLLVDTERMGMGVAKQVLAQFGFDATDDLLIGMIGHSEVESLRRLRAATGPDFDITGYEAARQSAFRARAEQGIPLKPGARELLQHLYDIDMPRAVGTNSRTDAGLRKLRQSGLDDLIHVVVGFDAVPAAKPAPDVFIEAARQLGVDPKTCIAFEDSEAGATAARAAGAHVVQIPDILPTGGDHADLVADTLIDGARRAGLI
ncbi:HAD family phosphatase [Actibacterium sp. 188UL27-1]|uniref:HAD family hydrolase n=1 Tax=Actibacterium sp. 188UL27-1 TaxID=2786961 RepID=UPI00195A4BB3|nr:HAD family phosphatase [Actibacterium sp. 188UL27-1]MBM7069495.1 HAD-IA family hydrolase [Actibacterium sp. 188UL27-1]